MKDKDEQKRERRRKAQKRKALSRIRKALVKAKELEEDQAFSDWENEFAQSLEEKLENFDSAFVDPEKGRFGDALSYRQAIKLKEIEDKAKGKKPKKWNRGNGFKSTRSKKNLKQHADAPDKEPILESVEEKPAPPSLAIKPQLKLIRGGKS